MTVLLCNLPTVNHIGSQAQAACKHTTALLSVDGYKSSGAPWDP